MFRTVKLQQQVSLLSVLPVKKQLRQGVLADACMHHGFLLASCPF